MTGSLRPLENESGKEEGKTRKNGRKNGVTGKTGSELFSYWQVRKSGGKSGVRPPLVVVTYCTILS
jgi:hypothetical protein